ncbi:MAG: trigger factor [Terrimicrobiaceae bacterium]
MNIVVESKPNCVSTLRVEVPADRVHRERETLTNEFQRHAKVPGYRPGKAPRSLIETRFAKNILEELGTKLVRESLSEAIKEKKLRVLSVTDVNGPNIASDDTLRFEATVITEPEFELPDYSIITADVTRKPVTEEDVATFLDRIKEPHSTFDPVEGRPVAMGDFAVASYAATLDGKPLSEAVPETPPQVCGKRNAWLLLSEDVLAPGFSASIAGLEVGGEKTFPLTLPEDFAFEPLRGKTLEYAVTLHAINAKNIPPLDDALADKIDPGSTVEELIKKIRERLESSADYTFNAEKRQAAINFLSSKVDCELPESFVAGETRGILQEIVRENQMRGISDDEIQNHQDELIGAAQRGARDRVRTNFLLQRVAEKEKLEATETDLTSLILELAQRYEIPVKKFVTDLKKKGGIDGLREQVLARKALDLLADKVTVNSVS